MSDIADCFEGPPPKSREEHNADLLHRLIGTATLIRDRCDLLSTSDSKSDIEKRMRRMEAHLKTINQIVRDNWRDE